MNVPGFLRLNPETVFEFGSNALFEIFGQASLDGVLLHTTFLGSACMLI